MLALKKPQKPYARGKMIDFKDLAEYWEAEANKARQEVNYWKEQYNREKDMVERLSLDLGLKGKENER